MSVINDLLALGACPWEGEDVNIKTKLHIEFYNDTLFPNRMWIKAGVDREVSCSSWTWTGELRLYSCSLAFFKATKKAKDSLVCYQWHACSWGMSMGRGGCKHVSAIMTFIFQKIVLDMFPYSLLEVDTTPWIKLQSIPIKNLLTLKKGWGHFAKTIGNCEYYFILIYLAFSTLKRSTTVPSTLPPSWLQTWPHLIHICYDENRH